MPPFTLINHITLQRGQALLPLKHPSESGYLYEYVFAENGVFLRARRDLMGVCMPIAPCMIRGLAPLTPCLDLETSRVPKEMVNRMFAHACGACVRERGAVEVLFHLCWNEDQKSWELAIPDQEATAVSVRPKQSGPNSSYERALIELHSHHRMRPYFSPTDDKDESGIRLYAVIGRICTRPTIRLRVGVYQHFWEIPATWVFDLPAHIRDANASEEAEEQERDEATETIIDWETLSLNTRCGADRF